MTVLGQLGVIAALVSSLASSLGYYRSAAGKNDLLAWPRRFVLVNAGGVALASGVLLTLLLRHDFSNGYVFSYSDRSLPLHYLISSFYAGQEGSFLFWALCSAAIALVLAGYLRRRRNEACVMAVFMAVQSLLLLLLLTKSPFRSLWDMFPDAPPFRVPPDGRGLNPLLQNLWMVIHPPVLFLGFAAMTVPFSMAIGGLWRREYALLSRYGIPWIVFGVAVLGLGIMLGAYWAYGVLGWGGYWGWDPVENSSLVPWLTGVALLHTLIAQMRTGRFVKTNIFLALITFLLVVYSTFLTRSGVLGDASVHSFSDPGAGVYWLLLAMLFLGVTVGGALIIVRWKDMGSARPASPIFTRETALGAGSIALILSAAVVLFGTSLPIFSQTRVEGSFYNTSNLPIAIVIALLAGLSLSMQWGMQDVRETLRRSMKSFLVALAATALAAIAGALDAVALAVIFASFFALAVNVEVGFRIIRGDPRHLGGKVAHAGLAVFLLGVICTGRFSSSEQVPLPLGSAVRSLGRTLSYTGSRMLPDGKYAFDVSVEDGSRRFVLSPVMFDAGQQGRMRTPDIASFLTRDVYISPLALEQDEAEAGNETYTIRKGETIAIGGVNATFVSFDMTGHGAEAMTGGGGGMAVGSVLEITDGAERETVTPVAIYQQGAPPRYKSTPSRLLNASIQLLSMHVGTVPTVTVGVQRPGTARRPPEVLVVEASIKPFINLIWGGTLLMMGGFVLSMLKRSREA